MNDDYIQTGRSKQKKETRDRILAAAQHFLNQGKDYSLEDVARKAGMSRATVYRYYSNVEVLSGEAGLDLNTLSPDTIYENVKHSDLNNQLLQVLEYYSRLAIEHEPAFRKYLSVAITSDSPPAVRGARRIITLQKVLENSSLPAREKHKLANFLTVIMGIEPMIVTKDVCKLGNDESIELLKWGLKLILKGLAANQG